MYSYYSLTEKIQSAISLIYTKLFWPRARLVRFPAHIRNKKNIICGKGFTTGYLCRIEAGNNKNTITIGVNCVIGDYTHIVANEMVKIGNCVLMASKVFISDTNHGLYTGNDQTTPLTAPNERTLYCKPVDIGDNVWIGENVSILPGVKIGDGCIIGANAVVTKSFDSNCIVGGNPARVIKVWNGVEWARKS